MAHYERFLAYFGAIWVLSLAIQLARFIYLYTRRSSLNRYKYERKGEQPWAFITGSSDGIGLAFAHELAREGFNIVLHGRNSVKLEGVQKALGLEYPNSNFRVVIADACQDGPQFFSGIDAIVQELRNLNLTILVNNVGGPPPKMEPLYKTFDNNLARDIDGVISMNIRFTTHLTASIIPLLSREQKPGLIMSIGSMADLGLPWLSMYSGTKSFVMSWTAALAREMKAEKRNIEVLGVVLATVTNVSFRKEVPTLMQPDAKTFARASLDRVGCGKYVVAGYWVHGVMRTVLGLLPESLVCGMVVKSVREEAEKDKKRD